MARATRVLNEFRGRKIEDRGEDRGERGGGIGYWVSFARDTGQVGSLFGLLMLWWLDNGGILRNVKRDERFLLNFSCVKMFGRTVSSR